MGFEFATAARIIFASGSVSQLAQLAGDKGRHALVVTGSQPGRVGGCIQSLQDAGLQHTLYPVVGEPTIDVVNQAKALALSAGCDLVIGIGGGSVLDSGKAIAALIPNEGEVLDYLEVIGKGQKLRQAPIPFIAVPTTAGTGAEVTKNAVLASPQHCLKVSLRDNRMLADIALLDPMLTCAMPPSVTASTGMDALTQLLEPYVSRLANPLTDAFCVAGLRRIGRSLRRVYAAPEDLAAREDMAFASLMGGLALANAKLGAVHGFAGVLGGMYAAPHGAICAALLPHVIKANIRALQERRPHHPVLTRFDCIASLILGGPSADAAAIDWIEETSQLFGIPALGNYGIQPADFDAIVEQSSRSSSMKGNPILLSAAELKGILMAAL